MKQLPFEDVKAASLELMKGWCGYDDNPFKSEVEHDVWEKEHLEPFNQCNTLDEILDLNFFEGTREANEFARDLLIRLTKEKTEKPGLFRVYYSADGAHDWNYLMKAHSKEEAIRKVANLCDDEPHEEAIELTNDDDRTLLLAAMGADEPHWDKMAPNVQESWAQELKDPYEDIAQIKKDLEEKGHYGISEGDS